MSSRDHAAAAAVARVAVAGDGAILGVGLAICAATSWVKYLASSSSLDRILSAPSPRISDLRALLAASDGECDGEGKLVVVRGQVHLKPTADSNWVNSKNQSALISQGSGERAVIVQQTQTCLYNEWRGIFGWSIDLHALFAKSWREQRSSSLRSVPFILVEGGKWPNSGYVHINLDGSTHPLPLTTVYHQLRPIQPTPYTFFQAMFGNGYPVALLDEEKILAIGKEMTAIGKCRSQNGALELKSCPDLPYFLSDMTKDEIEARLAANGRILFWSGVILGAFSIGVLSFTIYRNSSWYQSCNPSCNSWLIRDPLRLHLRHPLCPQPWQSSPSHHLINRLPSKACANQIPYQLLHQQPPTYSHLKTFGCLCYPWLTPTTPSKLHPRSQDCVFLGYSTSHKGYRCLNLLTNKIHISRYVVFHENSFPYHVQFPTDHPPRSVSPSSSHPPPYLLLPTSTLPPTSQPSTSSQTPTYTPPPQPDSLSHYPGIVQPLSTSTIPCSATSPTSFTPSSPPPAISTHPMQTRLKTGIQCPKKIFDLLAMPQPDPTPTSYAQAAKYSHWRAAMSEEFLALQKQGTWSLVPPPPHTTILGCKWTFKTKYRSDGQVERHKARLVAQGFNQEFGINYHETFSPVAKMPTIRILLLISLHRKWPTLQFDISNAFLHGDLHDEIYMHQPPGFTDNEHPKHVCKLHKALYGLKQAPRAWYNKFTSFLLDFGFSFSKADPSLLIYIKAGVQLFLLIYVDDLLLTGNNQSVIQQLLTQLQHTFSLKQLGTTSNFLGIQVLRTVQGLFLQQTKHATELLLAAGLQNCKPVQTPMAHKVTTTPENSQPYPDPHSYRRLAGSLNYLTITRPDLAFAANCICQHMHNPTIADYNVLKRTLRYIQGTLHYGLPLTDGPLQLRTYSDVDWAGDTQDRKSITGFCTFLGKSLISWCVKKQVTVAKSSTEAEYRALSSATSDVIWLRRLLADFQAPQMAPTPIFCDNTSAMALAHNPVFHARTKHIEIDYHFIRHHITNGAVAIQHITSIDQPADLLTKPLPPTRYLELRDKLSIGSPTAQFEGGC